MPKRVLSGKLTQNENIDLLGAAINGDMTMVITPTAVTSAATAEAWTRVVNVKVVDSNGTKHAWLTQDFTTTASIADTSTAGTASITSTTLSLVGGEANITVSGDAADWLATETDTLTIGDLTILGYTVTGGTSVETFA